ncbi:type III secretion system stator protein SctL [Mycetohabitans sp. B8]|uniref:type III secretion system stator protein SctL n=1 Tax=Mycetohabitans sp. B8 TaxID=2841845 RepID=UPI001F00BF4D|nr:type III secretion system stator protein SctL [Mycetohabitans sp. B8]MCG1042860.1 type III secretion system stator protein SctL [Mycetohabitans sp. B8]
MAIWLKSPYQIPHTDGVHVGASRDVIPAAEFGALLTIEQAYEQLEADRQETLERARNESNKIVEAARQSAQQILDDATREYETAAERGYRDGEQRALSNWMERLAELADSERRMQVRMRERLAQIVTTGVEQIVHVQHTDALFERALNVVDRIVEGAAYVRIFVSESDHDHACVAFERLAARWREMGRPFPLTVIADKKLPPGSCICESDFGSVDASLATQLRAMRTAITRALKHSLIECDNCEQLHDDGRHESPSHAVDDESDPTDAPINEHGINDANDDDSDDEDMMDGDFWDDDELDATADEEALDDIASDDEAFGMEEFDQGELDENEFNDDEFLSEGDDESVNDEDLVDEVSGDKVFGEERSDLAQRNEVQNDEAREAPLDLDAFDREQPHDSGSAKRDRT